MSLARQRLIPFTAILSLALGGCAYMLGLYYDEKVTGTEADIAALTSPSGAIFTLHEETKEKSYGCGDGHFSDLIYVKYTVTENGRDLAVWDVRELFRGQLVMDKDQTLMVVLENTLTTRVFFLSAPDRALREVTDISAAAENTDPGLRAVAQRRIALDTLRQVNYYSGADPKNKTLAQDLIQRLGQDALTALDSIENDPPRPASTGYDVANANRGWAISLLKHLMSASPTDQEQ